MERTERRGMISEAQKAATKRYNLKTKQFVFRLRLDVDADVIERLERSPNKVEYIRKLVREDVARGAQR